MCVDAAKDDAATRKDITTPGELAEVLREDFATRKIQNPTIPPDTYIDFMAPAKSTIAPQMRDFANGAGHGNVGIKSCYSWEFRRQDKRRQHVWGRPPHQNVATNIKCFCRSVAGRVDPNDVAFTPVCAPLGAAAADHSDNEEAALAGEDAKLINELRYPLPRLFFEVGCKNI